MDRNNRRLGTIQHTQVALRKESVDRNVGLSALAPKQNAVALRKESVDRNNPFEALIVLAECRSPQGERG